MNLNLPPFYATADEKTKQQLFNVAVESALSHCVSEDDLKKATTSSQDQTAFNNHLLSIVTALQDRVKALEAKSRAKKSQLEV